jgi:hypothetical protein
MDHGLSLVQAKYPNDATANRYLRGPGATGADIAGFMN